MKRILNTPVNEEELPMGPETYAPEGVETVVPATSVKRAPGVQTPPIKIEEDNH